MKAIKYKKLITYLKFLQIITSKYTFFITTLLLFIIISWFTFGNNNSAYLLSAFGHFIVWKIFYKKQHNKIIPERNKIKIAIKIIHDRKQNI